MQQLDELFAPWNRTDAPGLTVGLALQGEVIYRRGFGMASLETFVANTPRTRMRIASISKHFTALLTLLLAEEMKLDLDVPIRTYIPELSGPGGEPSVRLLLQHRGGSRDYLDLGLLAHGMAMPSRGAVLAAQVRQGGRNFAPGEAMIYNNGGYNLVSLAIERAGGSPFEAQLKRRLFDPVGMVDTESVPSDFEITPGIATRHLPLQNGRWRRGLFPCEEFRGEGAIVSTIDDMLRWTKHLRSRDLFGTPATWAELADVPRFPDGNVGVYSLGLTHLSYRGVRTIHHSGGVFGGSSQMLIFPDHDLDVVILANGAPGADPVKLAERVADIILAPHLGEPSLKIDANAYEELLGNWWSPESGMIYRLATDDGALSLSLCGEPWKLPLFRLSDGRVVYPGGSMGAIGVGLDEVSHERGLMIEFAGRRIYHKKIPAGVVDVEAFGRAANGLYFSADGDCTVTISVAKRDVAIRFADSYGHVDASLVCLGETVAAPSSPGAVHWSVLNFNKQDGQMSSFRLNSGRTRNLVFERIEP
jgi:D-aminopeptidase